jgi:hypothetical protein
MEESRLAINDGHFREGKRRAVIVKIGLFLTVVLEVGSVGIWRIVKV